MNCKLCKYNGGFVRNSETYAGWSFVCNAPIEHIIEQYWSYADGATLPGRHCGVLK